MLLHTTTSEVINAQDTAQGVCKHCLWGEVVQLLARQCCIPPAPSNALPFVAPHLNCIGSIFQGSGPSSPPPQQAKSSEACQASGALGLSFINLNEKRASVSLTTQASLAQFVVH